MRPDMDKVIVERPRTHQGIGYRAVRRAKASLGLVRSVDGVESMPTTKSPMKPSKHSRVSRKWLNENLSPLYRFLHANVGRSWNKIYAEVREHFGRTGAVQSHVFQHLLAYVERCPMRVTEEEFVTSNGYRRGSYRRTELYVDLQGILRRWSPPKAIPAGKERCFVSKGEDLGLVKIESVWYEVELTNRERRPDYGHFYPMLEAPFGLNPTTVHDWPATKMALSKRQLSKKELKKYGLSAT